ncbi:MAG: hypothetical protein WBI20_01435, partial [Burkholderiaceae bacterium]
MKLHNSFARLGVGEGRWIGCPFSSPGSRAADGSFKSTCVNTMLGTRAVWQPRIGPAPGHPHRRP